MPVRMLLFGKHGNMEFTCWDAVRAPTTPDANAAWKSSGFRSRAPVNDTEAMFGWVQPTSYQHWPTCQLRERWLQHVCMLLKLCSIGTYVILYVSIVKCATTTAQILTHLEAAKKSLQVQRCISAPLDAPAAA